MTGLTSLNEKLFVTNDVSLNSRLFVSADSSFNGNLAVSKNIIGQGTSEQGGRGWGPDAQDEAGHDSVPEQPLNVHVRSPVGVAPRVRRHSASRKGFFEDVVWVTYGFIPGFESSMKRCGGEPPALAPVRAGQRAGELPYVHHHMVGEFHVV
jgi:hypothetical protein